MGEPPSGELSLLSRLAGAVPGIADAPAGQDLRLATVPRLRRVVALAGSAYPAVENVGAVVAGAVTLECLRERCARTRVRDAALIMYTSGTTARPKGAVLWSVPLIPGWVKSRSRSSNWSPALS